MSFLSWQSIAWAAGLTIPPLVALYFLKLKRQEQLVPSTLLWKRAVQDLRVNSPFKRLRSSLLLLLQLAALLVVAAALGKPMFQTVDRAEDTVIILVDQSASMAVVEEDGQTRLELAKQQAQLCVDNLAEGARALVIAFCDRATVVCSFDTDKAALKRKINSIEQTQSSSTLGEALSLAEAYTQNIIIGTAETGSDIAPESAAPPATVFMFTDGRIKDADEVTLQKFDVATMKVTNVATRTDNVGITAMEARRHYEQPELLEITFMVENFGFEPVSCEAAVYIDGENRAVVPVELAGAPVEGEGEVEANPGLSARGFGVRDVFAGSGVVQVELWMDDALDADDSAWTVVEPARHLNVLLVTPGNLFLQNVLEVLPLTFETKTGAEYEAASDQWLLEGEISAYDVMIFDGHSTARLPQGNYLFWGAVPRLEGVAAGDVIDDQVFFNWDDTHPVLRHVAVEAILVYEWLDLTLPPEAVSLIEGQTSAVLSYFTRDASQYLISAFRLITEDDFGNAVMNTYWVTDVDFVVFMQNALQYLASNVAVAGKKNVVPGEPVTLPVPERTETVVVRRPDNTTETIPVAGYQTVHYARTRQVGVYELDPGVEGEDKFAVNLFDAMESRVAPAETLMIGAGQVAAQATEIEVNEPAWPYFLIALLVLLIIEWIVYNQRVFI